MSSTQTIKTQLQSLITKSKNTTGNSSSDLTSQVDLLIAGYHTGTGGLDTSDATASTSDILSGKTAYVNGSKITGTATVGSSSPSLQTKTVTPSESSQNITPDSGYDGLSQVTVNAISNTYIGSGITKKSAQTYTPSTENQTIASNQYLNGTQTITGDSNLIPENIKSGISIFGVNGTYTGSSSSGSGLAMKTGTTTSGTIDTGLSSIKTIVIYKDSVAATGLIQGIYNIDDGILHYTYCSSYSTWSKSYATSTSTSSSVSGGTFTLGTSGTSDLSSSTTYNWVAFGEISDYDSTSGADSNDNNETVSGNAVTVTKLTSDDSSKNTVYQNLFTVATEELQLQDATSVQDAFLSACDWIIEYMEYASTPSDLIDGYNQKQGNCYAYCQVQEAFCQMLSIPCHTYLGDGTQGQHTWNRVKIDDSWHFSDMVYYDQILAQNPDYLSYAQQLRMWDDVSASYSSVPDHGDSICRLVNGVTGENLGSYTEIDWDTIDESQSYLNYLR